MYINKNNKAWFSHVSVLVAIVIMLGLISSVAFPAAAAEMEFEDEYDYRVLENNTIEITGYWGVCL